jgi:hypothetical protein
LKLRVVLGGENCHAGGRIAQGAIDEAAEHSRASGRPGDFLQQLQGTAAIAQIGTQLGETLPPRRVIARQPLGFREDGMRVAEGVAGDVNFRGRQVRPAQQGLGFGTRRLRRELFGRLERLTRPAFSKRGLDSAGQRGSRGGLGHFVRLPGA